MNIQDTRRHRLYSQPAGILNKWVDARSLGARRLPYFDPLDGGVDAPVLILLESPARDCSWPRFVSRDNTGPSQRNLKRCLVREQTILWNLYPWLPDLDSPAEAITRSKIVEGITLLKEVMDLLPRLRVLILAGSVAQRAAPEIKQHGPELNLLVMPHPSPLSVCQHPDVATNIVTTLTRAASVANA
ncbi:uracil-DNA glycosylase (plasmid) [Pseudomonas sp. HR96]|uniref:uracil-DNA glycosylase n=1 Tax=Pseudomonas sp. HR96 TaxID=1027966 RepID=UPI002A74A7AE|nr:uracil-DNA glycosylase [Pseudomonas sp. HR96]WPP02422.1 uracil-DNA glycosylase [Pseudomonas sp. HR96]